MFTKKIFNLKVIFILFFCIIGFAKFAKADVKIHALSNWDLWHFYPFKKSYDTYFFLTGSSNAVVQSTNNNNLKLYFGINSARDGNFNLINNTELLLYGNIYVSSDFNDNSNIVFGFKPGELDKTAIMANRQYNYGMPGIALFNSYNNLFDERVVFDGSYMQYNNAFSFTYNKKMFLSNTNFGITFTPNLDYNISKNNSLYKKLQKHMGAVDGFINYYNEYNDIGYGLIAAARIYTKLAVNPKGAEFYITPNIDYLGFGVAASFLGGFIDGTKNNFVYELSEVSIYYSVLKLNLMASYGYNNIRGGKAYGKYYYNNFNFNVNYLVNSYIMLKGSFFYNKTNKYKTNNGIAIGFNIKI